MASEHIAGRRDLPGRVEIVSLADRPDLFDAWRGIRTSWPEFMLHDPVAARLFHRVPGLGPSFQLIGVRDDGEVVAALRAVPFAWDGDLASLPAGWDAVLERAVADADAGRTPTAVSLLEAVVRPDSQGTGISVSLIEAARRQVAAAGLRHLFGPVRPSAKHREPVTPIAEYVARRRPDGLPTDPWLRVHVRLGGVIVRVADRSMTVPGTLAEWREWTGLPFDTAGSVEVPQALVPVQVDLAADRAVYVEPNVWVHHRLGSRSALGSTSVESR
jgi:GNAT superfamily N-acetyltransferase